MIVLWMMLTGFVRGIHEGMIHIQYSDPLHANEFQEGIRGHKWHSYYHLIASLRDLLLLGLGLFLVLLNYQYADILAGVFLIWEFGEIGYSVARTKHPIMFNRGRPYERIVPFDLVKDKYDLIVRGNAVYVLHVVRILFALGVMNAS